MTNRSRPRTIFIEHDNLDMGAAGGDHYLATYDYNRETWVLDYGVAADFLSNWEHDRPDRATVEGKGGTFALATVTQAGAAESAVWTPFAGVGSLAEYALNRFPFQPAFTVTTPVPPQVTPTPLPTDAAFAEFGKRAAAIIAGSENWNGDVVAAIRDEAQSFLGVELNDTMSEETWSMWKPLVEQAGMEMWDYEGEDD